MELEERARRGVELLKKNGVDVHEMISLDRLDINSIINCALCCVYGTYSKGLDVLNLRDDSAPWPRTESSPEAKASDYGFCLSVQEYVRFGKPGYNQLTQAWVKVLKEVAPEASGVVG